MDRFMLHLKNGRYGPADAKMLLGRARDLSSGMSLTVRDTRVSSRYIEYDISVPKEDLDGLVARLEPVGSLDHARHIVEEEIPKDDAIRDGVRYFNTERFWECHEALEGVWKKCYEGEKDLVQGIILVAAALVHHQKDEDDICLSILGRAIKKLADAQGTYFGIDVNRIREKASAMISSGKISTFEI